MALPTFPALEAAGVLAAQEVTEETAKPGGVAGLFFVGLLVAAFLLWRSMNRHLKVAQRNLGPRSGSEGADAGAAESGQEPAEGPTGTGIVEDDTTGTPPA